MLGKNDRKGKESQSDQLVSENLADWFKKNITDPDMIRWYVEQLQSHTDLKANKPDTEN